MIAGLLYKLYALKSRRLRWLIRKIVCKLEGGEIYSLMLRRIMKKYHGVEIGMYTHGGCFVPGRMDFYTTIGRYCSISRSVKVFNRNHNMKLKSTHAFFFNHKLGYCDSDLVEYIPISIGNDVWIGDSVIILPSVTEIADGAVIGAGSVITKNVPPYAVVVGYPSRIVRFRFPNEIIKELLASKWWEKDIEQIKLNMEEFQQPYEKLYFDKKVNTEE